MADYVEIGMPTPRVDGVAKVTGAARYVADQPIPGALAGALVHSTRSHARIVEVDTAEARALPGVHAVITGEDVGHYLRAHDQGHPRACTRRRALLGRACGRRGR